MRSARDLLTVSDVFARALVVALVLAGCGMTADERALPVADVSPTRAAIDRFVHADRTPAAFAELARTFETLRGGDPVIAVDAELRLLALAIPLLERARFHPNGQELDELALTVWPTLLSDPLTGAAVPTVTRATTPRLGESSADYVARLCATTLAAECASAPPPVQPIVVRSVVLRTAEERMTQALARCLFCTADGPQWQRLGWRLESLADDAAHQRAAAVAAGRVATRKERSM